MGRPRSNPEGLPKRVYNKHGAYHYVDVDGRWHRLGVRWDREAKDEYAKVSSSVPHSGSVAELLANYLLHLAGRLAANKLSPRHYADRTTDAEKLKLFFGHMPATSVKRKHIALYLANRVRRIEKGGVVTIVPAPIRANREVAMLSAAFNWDANLEHNPCLHVPRNEENSRDRYVEHWERRQFAKRCCPDWLRAYLLLKYLTGLRMGDMLRLSRANETPTGLRVVIGKSRKHQVLEFGWTRALRCAIRFIHRLAPHYSKHAGEGASKGGTERVRPLAYFARGHGHPLTASGFKSAWRRAMSKWKDMGNEPFWEHDIRAKTASDSSSDQAAQERLGHDTIRTTRQHYLRGPARTKRVTPLR